MIITTKIGYITHIIILTSANNIVSTSPDVVILATFVFSFATIHCLRNLAQKKKYFFYS
ncbi:monovalent cation/H+ antiporter subunit C domain protein [Bacteroides fluxus YIT 12057]|uniref:Monovalent cation/H+ antiporter subunit C domain protein n=1 Tax=Bacteroides fluxus YIT 12057 TaxID=763034 RepID=F3PS80_9BACE|nr:monovalent cation/H+ antiporter subunit C domain protein [Bacteroides fluxus YIT 12057]